MDIFNKQRLLDQRVYFYLLRTKKGAPASEISRSLSHPLVYKVLGMPITLESTVFYIHSKNVLYPCVLRIRDFFRPPGY